MESLRRRFGDKAEFFVVYIREAHPSDGWQMGANRREIRLVEEGAPVAKAEIFKLDLSWIWKRLLQVRKRK